MSARISVATGFTALGMTAGIVALAIWAPERLVAPQDLRGWLLMLGALTALASLGIILANLIGAPAPRTARVGVQALRPIILPEIAETAAVSEDDAAMARLEAMVGLAPVKQEIRSLIARAKVDAMRRDQGQQVTAVSQHMVFTGPPGVGKTEVARVWSRAMWVRPQPARWTNAARLWTTSCSSTRPTPWLVRAMTLAAKPLIRF